MLAVAGMMPRLKGAKSGWRGPGLISWCRGGLVRAYGAYEGMPKRLTERIAAELEGSGMHLGRRRARADFAEPVGPSVSGTSFESGVGEEGLGGRAVRPRSPDKVTGRERGGRLKG